MFPSLHPPPFLSDSFGYESSFSSYSLYLQYVLFSSRSREGQNLSILSSSNDQLTDMGTASLPLPPSPSFFSLTSPARRQFVCPVSPPFRELLKGRETRGNTEREGESTVALKPRLLLSPFILYLAALIDCVVIYLDAIRYQSIDPLPPLLLSPLLRDLSMYAQPILCHPKCHL